MIRNQKTLVFLLTVIVLTTLACSLGTNLPFGSGEQEASISPEDVAEAATRAAEAAATAGVFAEQTNEEIATATVVPVETPVISVPVTGSSLEQKLASIQPDANGNFTLDITEEDLNEFLVGQDNGGIQTEGLNVANVRIGITPESVKLAGDVKEPLELPLTIELSPTVVNGQLHFAIDSASAGLFPVPDSMLDLIEATANTELTQALVGLPANVTLQDAQLDNGVLRIFGHMN
ncbi:MAG: hypothetical protein R3293_24150 [Candidatus Promineifilaceae bacterium]|nr:hypothetical protein [Candidatus Promineifilaceae bacterium]